MMRDKDYGVRVLRAYENRSVGQVFFPPGTLRQVLINRGFVEAVPDNEAEDHLSAPRPPAKRRLLTR